MNIRLASVEDAHFFVEFNQAMAFETEGKQLDPNVVDQWGIPVLRFHWKWSDHEIKQAEQNLRRNEAQLRLALAGSACRARPGLGRAASAPCASG